MLTLMKPEIEQYARQKTACHGDLLEKLAEETIKSMPMPEMLTGPLEGRFLKQMVMVTGARRILEVGMYTGYSALSMAEGLPEGGELITLEIDDKAIAFASRYFESSPHGKKIKVMKGPALDSLEQLTGEFDLVFIDADKVNYSNYYEAILPKLKKGGVILVDNVLYSGEVLDPQSENAKAIHAFNELVSKDDRVEKVLLTIRDGVYFLVKK